MPTKTIYIREADLGIWDEAQRIYGEKSMSMLFVECLNQKLQGRDGFLHVLRAESGPSKRLGQFAIMFGPNDSPGAMKPHYCRGIQELKKFLREIGLIDTATAEIVNGVTKTGSCSIRISLPQAKIDLI